ncbi:MAG TPA: ABC transporter permease [Actinopolymorphaceae bacterium]|jgi:ABC-type multidrug transport system permease subunit
MTAQTADKRLGGATWSARLYADGRVILAAARIGLLQLASHPIMLLRAPLTPVMWLITFVLAYDISGQRTVPTEDVVGFLVIGILAVMAWDCTIWGSGNALQSEIYNGTIGTTFAAPARTGAVVVGYGLGRVVWGFTGVASCLVVGALLGARFDVADPLAAVVCLVALYASTMCVGVGFAGLFILSRQSNAMSNFLQVPTWLLAGFFVPRTVLPDWLHVVSDAIPLAHAVDALRAVTLAGSSLADVSHSMLATALTSLGFLVAGIWSLNHTDNALRKRATLDLL